MNDGERALWEQFVGSERKRMIAEPVAPPRPVEVPTIHYSELPEDNSGGRGSIEWNCYRREAGRLLTQGHEGRWLLIKGDEIVGIWDSEAKARAVAVERYLLQPVVIRQLLEREPVLPAPTFVYRCRN